MYYRWWSFCTSTIKLIISSIAKKFLLGDHLRRLSDKSLILDSSDIHYHNVRLINLIYVKLVKEASKNRDSLVIIITRRTSMKDSLLYGEGKSYKFDNGRISNKRISDINTRFINYLNVSESLIQEVISSLEKEGLSIIFDVITFPSCPDKVYGLNISW